MIFYLRLIAYAVVMFVGVGWLLRAQPSQVRAEVHWSEKATIVAPDKRWQIDVSPEGEDGPAIVSIKKAFSKKKNVLFRLQRDAFLLWNPSSTSLIVADEEFSDNYRLMIFHSPFLEENEHKGLEADRTIRTAVEKTLSSSERINYYLPDVIGWRDGGWLIIVGIKVLHGDAGPFSSHCSGYLLNPSDSKIIQSFTDQELERKYGATCQM